MKLFPLPSPFIAGNTVPYYAPIGDMILAFDGESDYVRIPTADDINFGPQDDFTVEFWAKPEKEQVYTKHGDNEMVEKWSGTGGYPYAIRYLNQTVTPATDRGKVIATRFDGDITKLNSAVISNITIDDGDFHHIAFVRATGNGTGKLYLYIDGRLHGGPVDDYATGDTTNDSPLYLGRRGGNPANDDNFFTGQLGRVRIWQGALTEEQVKATMYQTLTGKIEFRDQTGKVTAKLVGNWRSDEGYGSLTFDYAGWNTGLLGGGTAADEPNWVVSTILPPMEVIDPIPPHRARTSNLNEGLKWAERTLKS